MSKNTRKKKAFTLTELLVVVVVIGVLAAVALPKFSKVMETRKTTEAEQIMAAVRTEQEYRCAMDKPYTADFSSLSQSISASESTSATSTKDFDYELQSTGMLARRKGENYALEMPSYADGRLCCNGSACANLNKDYMSCTDLMNTADYQPAVQCTPADVSPSSQNLVEPPHVPCEGKVQPADLTVYCHEEDPNKCGIGKITYVCINDNYEQQVVVPCTTAPTDQTPEIDCPSGCGKKTRAYSCVNNAWTLGEYTTPYPEDCAKTPEEEEPCSKSSADNKTRSVTCNEETGQWILGDWDESACSVKRPCSELAIEKWPSSADWATQLYLYCAEKGKIFESWFIDAFLGDVANIDACCLSCSQVPARYGGDYGPSSVFLVDLQESDPLFKYTCGNPFELSEMLEGSVWDIYKDIGQEHSYKKVVSSLTARMDGCAVYSQMLAGTESITHDEYLEALNLPDCTADFCRTHCNIKNPESCGAKCKASGPENKFAYLRGSCVRRYDPEEYRQYTEAYNSSGFSNPTYYMNGEQVDGESWDVEHFMDYFYSCCEYSCESCHETMVRDEEYSTSYAYEKENAGTIAHPAGEDAPRMSYTICRFPHLDEITISQCVSKVDGVNWGLH